MKNGVRIRPPSALDLKPFLAAVARSRRLHGRWVSAPRTEPEFVAYLRRSRRRSQCAYLVCTPDGALAGVINISEIVRGSLCSGYLGYYAFAPHAKQGFMTQGMRLVVERAFKRLRLHRLEANIQPANSASRRLVRRLGFRCEGYSERYLKVAGRFRDHERWALTVEEWIPGTAATTRRGRRATARPARSAKARRSRGAVAVGSGSGSETS